MQSGRVHLLMHIKNNLSLVVLPQDQYLSNHLQPSEMNKTDVFYKTFLPKEGVNKSLKIKALDPKYQR